MKRGGALTYRRTMRLDILTIRDESTGMGWADEGAPFPPCRPMSMENLSGRIGHAGTRAADAVGAALRATWWLTNGCDTPNNLGALGILLF